MNAPTRSWSKPPLVVPVVPARARLPATPLPTRVAAAEAAKAADAPMTAAQLADAIGALDASVKADAKRLDALKEEAKALGVPALGGLSYAITITETVTKRLDTKAVEGAFGDKLAGFYKSSTSQTLRIAKVGT